MTPLISHFWKMLLKEVAVATIVTVATELAATAIDKYFDREEEPPRRRKRNVKHSR